MAGNSMDLERAGIDKVINDTFVVIPAYNEGQVIGDVVNEVINVFPNVIIVDDGSSDDTVSVLQGSAALIVRHFINLGQGAALQTGIAYALERGARFIVTFDADGQHRVEDAVNSVRVLSEGDCDVVCGSRFLSNDSNIPWQRKIVLKVAIAWSNLTTETKMTDAHNGLRALSRAAATSLDLSQSGMAHASQIIRQLNEHRMRIKEIPIQIRYTKYSLAKGQSLFNSVNIAADLFVERFLK